MYEDWVNQIFTADEARFLNTLGFTPLILQKVFEVDNDKNIWKNKLADFLEGAVVSKCFTDNRFQLSSECEKNQNFIENIFAYFVENNLDVEKIRERQEYDLTQEFSRYHDELEANNEAQAVQQHEEGVDVEEIRPRFFGKTKKTWQSLYIYHTSNDTVAANIITVNKYTGEYHFKRVEVPEKDYERDSTILYKKINALKQKYPGIYIIY